MFKPHPLKHISSSICRSIFRVKSTHVESQHPTSDSDLSKCLTTADLTHLGIGSILGAGIYVVSGQVALNIAGPSVVFSFTIAALASLLSGLSYSEFASRVPNTTGSAYAYSYHTVGEFLAFLIGWNLILEYMIGTAADARALSGAIDYLADHRLSNFSIHTFGYIPSLHTHADLAAMGVTLLVTGILAIGVKESARYTMLFNFLNGGVAILVVGFGALKAKAAYWESAELFFPNGAHGVFAGAAACFYAFVGFDIIATTGEEAKSASKSIPTAVALSLIICYCLYIGVSVIITMLIPFGSLQRSQSPLTEAFDRVGFSWAKWLIGCGAAFGLGASLLGSEFPLPRIIYAMAVDGLLFKFFRYVHPSTETPLWATLIPGIMTGFFSLMFDLRELVEMMSIGTLLAYSLVCTSVMLLRYRVPPASSYFPDLISSDEDGYSLQSTPDRVLTNGVTSSPTKNTSSISADRGPNKNGLHVTKHVRQRCSSEASHSGSDEMILSDTDQREEPLLGDKSNRHPINRHRIREHESTTALFCSRLPTVRTQMVVIIMTCALWIFAILFALLLLLVENHLTANETHPHKTEEDVTIISMANISMSTVAPRLDKIVKTVVTDSWEHLLWGLAACCGLGCLLSTLVIACQPQDWATVRSLHFHVPLVPWLPACAIITNIFLMARLSRVTWIRFLVWLVIGLLIFFGYSVWNSEEGLKQRRHSAPSRITMSQLNESSDNFRVTLESDSENHRHSSKGDEEEAHLIPTNNNH